MVMAMEMEMKMAMAIWEIVGIAMGVRVGVGWSLLRSWLILRVVLFRHWFVYLMCMSDVVMKI
jgi:hypothetical protein